MSDNRADIKIEFEIFGRKFKTNMSINYYPEDEMVDSRITDWFEKCYDEACETYQDICNQVEKERQEQIERETYLRLKAKYEN